MDTLKASYFDEQVDQAYFTRPYTQTLKDGKNVPTCFLTINEVSELMGISVPTVRKIFHQRDFPAVHFGKTMVVEIHAFILYFSIPRTKFHN